MEHKLIPLTLKQHQQILYEILYMVDDFCRDHHIDYFLVGGSLLGAVRHQGIIPWDDDVDIAMTRENYSRFIALFHAERVEGYDLYDFEHVKGFLYPFAKMAKADTWTSSSDTHKICIDIFAYDGCADDLEDAQLYFVKNREAVRRFTNYFIYKFNDLYDCWKAKLTYIILQFPKDFLLFFPMQLVPGWRDRYMKKLYSRCARLRVSETKYCANNAWGIYGKGEVQSSASFLILDKMLFGSRKLPVPSGWHDYLTGLYGDYEKEPTEANRHRHHKNGTYLIVRPQRQE